MSEQTTGRRRIAARVVPLVRITPVAVSPVQPDRSVPRSGTTLRDAPGRQRAYGAPLAAATRIQRASQKIMRIAFQNAMAASAAPFESCVTDLPAGRDKTDTAQVVSAGDLSPLILWEQPPQPQNLVQPAAPRWIENVSLVPNEQEFSELSAYLVYLVDGFARFCRSPDVLESGCWQARLPMPLAVLPDTMLDLNLSPLMVRLRFETQHPVSRELLSRYVSGLKVQLCEALGQAREVEVSLW